MNNTQSMMSETDLNKIIEKSIGTNTEKVYNASKDLILVKQTNLPETSFVRFIVIDASSGNIIYQGSYKPGYVQWKSNESIEILNIPGIIPAHKTQADYTTIISLSRTSI